MPLPNVNPSYYHALAILLSVLYLYAFAPAQRITIIGIVLLADWLDGATVRRYRQPNKAGCVIDLVTDRVSEAFIFAAEVATVLGQAFFLLWIVNCFLTYYSVRANTHTTLPLRLAYLAVLVVQLYAPVSSL
jgi:phosphatidylglycerophosphate synthase